MSRAGRSSLAGQGLTGADNSVGPDQLNTTNTGSAGDILTKGSGTNDLTYAAPGGASIGNGSIDPVKLADISTGSAQGGKLIALASNGVDFALATPFTLGANDIPASYLNAGTATNGYALFADSAAAGGFAWKINAPANSTVTPAKIADITVGSGIAGKLLGFNADNHAEFEIIDPFTVSDIGAGEITNTMLADDSVDIDVLDIDGTAAVGKIAKVYDDNGTLKLQWADDNNSGGGGGGGNVSYPIDLSTASNFSNDLPIAQGGTGASTAAAARANLGVAAAGGNSTEAGDLPTVTAIDAQPAGHIGEWISTSTGKPDSGSDSGVVERLSGGDQIATVGETGTTYFRTHSTSVDANWGTIGTPSPALSSVTTIAQMRAITNYQIVESTFTNGNPQNVANCIISRFPGGFGGHGFLCAIPPGGVGFWVAELPSATFEVSDLSWQTFEFAPLPPEFNQYLHRGGAYEKVPAGQTGLVLDLQISGTDIADALVSHTYTESTTSSSYKADFYTTGSTVRESTRGHTHSIGTWAKTQIGTDQIVDHAISAAKISTDLVITESDGKAVSRMKHPALEDVELAGYSLISTANPSAGEVGYDAASRTVVVQAKAGDETLLDEIVEADFEFSIEKTSSGQAASVRGVFSSDPIELNGVLRASLRADDLQTVGTLAAGDTVKIAGHKAVYTKLDTIPPVALGIGHGSSQANHLVKMNPSGSALTAGHLDADNLPTTTSDINDITDALRVRQFLDPVVTFSNTYAYESSGSASALAAGEFYYPTSGIIRPLRIAPASSADSARLDRVISGLTVSLDDGAGNSLTGTVSAVSNLSSNYPSGSRQLLLAATLTGSLASAGAMTLRILSPLLGRDEDIDIADGSLRAAAFPTSLSDIQSINERLTLRQKLEPRDFGTTYAHSASASGVTAGRIRWNDTSRELTINPLAADDKLIEYFSVLGVDVELTSTNGAVIHSTVEAVVSNPAGTPAGAITVRLKDLAHHYAGDIRSGNVTIKTLGSFIGRGDTGVVQRDALDAGTGSAGQVLSRTSTGLAWVNQSSGGGGGGDTFTAAEYSSKVFSTNYNRNATLANLPAGDYYWDDTNKRLTINPASADTDLTTRTPVGSRFELRGASGLRLDGIISSRPSNPAGAPSAAFTLQFDTAQQTFYQSSGFAASTANMVAYCHGKVASWDAMGSTVSGLFGAIDREMLDTTNSPSNGQILGVGASLDSSDRRLVWVDRPSDVRVPKRFINYQDNIDNTSISGTTYQPLLDGTAAMTLKMQIVHAEDWLELISDGVCNCSSGTLQAYGIEVGWQFRTATSESGLSTATYEEVDTQRRGHGMGDTAYRTKQAGGGSGGTAPRDPWVLSNDWVSLSHITSNGNPTTAGRWIELRVRHRLPDTAFSGSAIGQRYGFQIKMTCIPNTDITDQN